jgi:tyrosyl-tRNA synthetase
MIARVLTELRQRHLLHDLSNSNFANHMTALLSKGRSPSVYAGFDPTGPSLHLGHLAVIMALSKLQQAGLRPVILVRAYYCFQLTFSVQIDPILLKSLCSWVGRLP